MKTKRFKTFAVPALCAAAFLSGGWACAATKDYTMSGFKANSDRSACSATVSVSISGSPSVTKTRFTGNSGTKKPTNVNLAVGSKSDDTTPTGSDGSWAGSTNSFNGSSFSNGSWTMIIKPSTPLPSSGSGVATKVTPATVKPATSSSGPTLCKDFDGTKLTFEYS